MLDGGMPYNSHACLIESIFYLIARSANRIDYYDHVPFSLFPPPPPEFIGARFVGACLSSLDLRGPLLNLFWNLHNGSNLLPWV